MNRLQDTVHTDKIGMVLMPGDNNHAIDHAMRTFAQAGICVLKIFQLVFPEQFAKIDGQRRVEEISRTL
jgi:hypothetical protein